MAKISDIVSEYLYPYGDQKINNKEIAKKIGSGENSVYNWDRGTSMPVDKLLDICILYNIPVSYFISRF